MTQKKKDDLTDKYRKSAKIQQFSSGILLDMLKKVSIFMPSELTVVFLFFTGESSTNPKYDTFKFVDILFLKNLQVKKNLESFTLKSRSTEGY